VELGSRREAFKILGGLLVCGTTSMGIVHYAVRREPSVDETVRLGPLSEFPVGEFQRRSVTVNERGTWFEGQVEKTVWVRRNPDDTLLVLSGTCPHMNCTVNLLEDRTFECPCHHSRFDADGQKTSEPAPRALDTLEYRISSEGIVSVQFQNFRRGLETKQLVPQ